MPGAAAFLLDLIPGLGAAAEPDPVAILVLLPYLLLLETVAPVRTKGVVCRKSRKALGSNPRPLPSGHCIVRDRSFMDGLWGRLECTFFFSLVFCCIELGPCAKRNISVWSVFINSAYGNWFY